MSAPFRRHYATARSGNAGASGMRMALDCARSIYEAVDRRMPEATALAALQQAVHEHARACRRFVESAAAAPDEQILCLVEQEQRLSWSGKALGQPQSRQSLMTSGLAALFVGLDHRA